MRHILSSVLVTIAVLLSLSSIVYGAAAKVPPGSYVRQRATSVAALAEHVRNDSVVRQRYAKHYGIPANEVATYFEKIFTLTTLKTSLRADVWYVNKRGATAVKKKLLPKGTAVFVDSNGKPLMVWSCGNPMTKKLELPEEPKAVEEEIEEIPEEEEVKASPIEEIVVIPEPEIIEEIPEIEELTPVEVTIGDPPVELAVAPVEIEIPPIIEEIPSVVVPSGSPDILGALVGITGGVTIFDSLQGGKKTPNGGDNNVVPEPSSFAGLATGIVIFGAYRGLAFRRKK